ncbi:polynucleotide kinase 3 phosphatase-domain-containing protein [Globomyces pollinis-pini]|nr:polynucleotide kinase 3 phosphatase-domain-containing protein [Globomyces pollinis-pini]
MKRSTSKKIQSTEKKQRTLDSFKGITNSVVEWKVEGTVLTGTYSDFTPKSKVAAFDFDGTIASVKGKYSFPKDSNDWVWFDPSIPSILLHLDRLQYCLVIFSNQRGIEESKNLKKKVIFQSRIEKTIKEIIKYCETLDLKPPPMKIYAATEKDIYRKPCQGMWLKYQNTFKSIIINQKESFFCGDAAGRSTIGRNSHAKDHADTDWKFALNCDLPFILPQEIFHSDNVKKYLKEPKLHLIKEPSLVLTGFDPKTYTNSFEIPQFDHYDILICVGSPASGKSSFCKRYLPNHQRINQDELKNVNACIKTAKQALSSGQKVVIDNTNPTKDARKKFIDIANDKTIACIYFNTDLDIAQHNKQYRELHPLIRELAGLGNGSEPYPHVPMIALYTFFKKFERPAIDEGFHHVYEIPFVPCFEEGGEEFWRLYY